MIPDGIDQGSGATSKYSSSFERPKRLLDLIKDLVQRRPSFSKKAIHIQAILSISKVSSSYMNMQLRPVRDTERTLTMSSGYPSSFDFPMQ